MKVFINSKQKEISQKSLFELRKHQNQENSLTIINGFATSEDVELKENDTIFFIQKGVFPKKDELEAMMMSRHTPNVHKKLKNSKVAIAGLGGLGSNIAVSLARIGVGKLLLVDFDIVEPSNLNRQSYFIEDLGKAKTKALKQQIKKINPFIKIKTKTIKVSEKNIEKLFSKYPIICEAFDKADQKAMLVNGVLEKLPNSTIIAASGLAGFESSNKIKTKRAMERLYICGDLEAEAKIGNGLMSPRVMLCAAHQANMVLRVILNEKEV